MMGMIMEKVSGKSILSGEQRGSMGGVEIEDSLDGNGNVYKRGKPSQ
jgi:hypothetical protein